MICIYLYVILFVSLTFADSASFSPITDALTMHHHEFFSVPTRTTTNLCSTFRDSLSTSAAHPGRNQGFTVDSVSGPKPRSI